VGGQRAVHASSAKTKKRSVTTMSNLFSRKTVMLVWLVVVLGLFAALEAPMSFTTGVLLLAVWGTIPAIMLVLWQTSSPRMAEALHRAESPSQRER
jgi:hypothetical protein